MLQKQPIVTTLEAVGLGKENHVSSVLCKRKTSLLLSHHALPASRMPSEVALFER